MFASSDPMVPTLPRFIGRTLVFPTVQPVSHSHRRRPCGVNLELCILRVTIAVIPVEGNVVVLDAPTSRVVLLTAVPVTLRIPTSTAPAPRTLPVLSPKQIPTRRLRRRIVRLERCIPRVIIAVILRAMDSAVARVARAFLVALPSAARAALPIPTIIALAQLIRLVLSPQSSGVRVEPWIPMANIAVMRVMDSVGGVAVPNVLAGLLPVARGPLPLPTSIVPVPLIRRALFRKVHCQCRVHASSLLLILMCHSGMRGNAVFLAFLCMFFLV